MTCFELLLQTWHQNLFLQLKHSTQFYILVWNTLWLKILWWYTARARVCVCVCACGCVRMYFHQTFKYNAARVQIHKTVKKINIRTLLFTVYRMVKDHNWNFIKWLKNVYTKIQNCEKACSWCYLIWLITMCLHEILDTFYRYICQIFLECTVH
jgi:hypothetical protein